MTLVTRPAPSHAVDGTRERSTAARQGDGMGTIIKLARRLARQGVSISSVTPSAHPFTIEIATGDRIRFLTRHDPISIVSGTVATVTRVKATNVFGCNLPRNQVRLRIPIGSRAVDLRVDDLADDMGRIKLLAHASTIYGAQGLAVERATVLLSPSFDRHDIHAAASRARGAATLVIDRSAADKQIQAERRDRTGLNGDAVTDAEPLAWLADRLSRANVNG